MVGAFFDSDLFVVKVCGPIVNSLNFTCITDLWNGLRMISFGVCEDYDLKFQSQC